ncbi:hypothetical protein JCM12298_19220 [Desulfothermus naphthae]
MRVLNLFIIILDPYLFIENFTKNPDTIKKRGISIEEIKKLLKLKKNILTGNLESTNPLITW